MTVAVAGVLAAALAAWLVGMVYAVRFARALWIWRDREDRGHAWRDPASNMVTVVDFLRGGAHPGNDQQEAMRAHGLRMGKVAFLFGLGFAACIGLAIVIASVGDL